MSPSLDDISELRPIKPRGELALQITDQKLRVLRVARRRFINRSDSWTDLFLVSSPALTFTGLHRFGPSSPHTDWVLINISHYIIGYLTSVYYTELACKDTNNTTSQSKWFVTEVFPTLMQQNPCYETFLVYTWSILWLLFNINNDDKNTSRLGDFLKGYWNKWNECLAGR